MFPNTEGYSVRELVYEQLRVTNAAVMEEVGASKPVYKTALLVKDVDRICSRMGHQTQVEIQSKSPIKLYNISGTIFLVAYIIDLLMLQLAVITGLRPSSMYKCQGAGSYFPGLLLKDVRIL